MLKANPLHRTVFGRFRLICLVLLLTIIVPVAAYGATTNSAVTVTNTVTVDNLSGINEIVLAGLVETEQDQGPLVLGLKWALDTSGWFPTWKLQLTSAPALVAATPSTKATTSNSGTAVIDLGSIQPVRGHAYETTLSYSAPLGALAIKVHDVTDDKLIYTNGFEVASHEAPLFALSGTTTSAYIPVGTTWSTGIGAAGKHFLAIGHYASRDEEAAIRIMVPSAAPGEYRVTLEYAGEELTIASLRAHARETWVPLSLDQFPLGQSRVRLDYIENGEVLLTESRPVTVGRVDFWMQPVAPRRADGALDVLINVQGSEPLTENVTAAVHASLYELVWNADKRAFEETLVESGLTLYQGALDLSTGTTRLPLQLSLPEQQANWKIVVSTEVEPKVGSSIGGNERLFSTHLPAEIGLDEPYTIVVLPDTQYFASSYPHIFTRMTDWITANAAELGIAAVLHVGDITDNDTPTQWERAYRSMSLLHGVVPYVVTLGNHDMTNGVGGQVSQRGLTLLNNYFTAEDAKLYSNLAGTMVPNRLENHYSLFSIGGTDYLVIALEFGPPNEAVEWANEVAARYPDHKMILLTHSYTATTGGRSRSPEGYPLASNLNTTVNSAPEMWDKFVRRHANSFMVVSGHTSPPLTIAHNVALASTGQPVFELLFDYQNQDNGGNGWLGLMTFHPDDTVDVRVFSPYLDAYANDRDARGFTSHILLHLNTGLVRRIQD